MNQILNWGLEVIRDFQTVSSPFVDGIFKLITMLGDGALYFIITATMYWSFRRERAVRLMLLMEVAGFSNQFLKSLFAQPRPFDLDPSLGIGSASGYGLPSGHSQGSATFWGAIAPWYRGGWPVAVVVSLLVRISRVCLGVHFPSDVLAGWLLAAVTLIIYHRFADRMSRWLEARSWKLLLLLAVAAGLAALAAGAGDYRTPALVLGIGTGLVLMRRFARFSGAGRAVQCLLRSLLGFSGAGILYAAFQWPALWGWNDGRAVTEILTYTVISLWITFGAPWFFIRLGLAERDGR